MKQLQCPLNGLRNISEFTYGGEVENMPDVKTTDDKEWSKYIFFHDNNLGIVKEWWCHTASTYWFIAERNTFTDEITKTYDPQEIFNKKMSF